MNRSVSVQSAEMKKVITELMSPASLDDMGDCFHISVYGGR